MERGFVVEAARVHVCAEADELFRGLSGTAVCGYVERRPFAVEFPSVDGEPCAQERDERRRAVLKCRRVDERIAIFVLSVMCAVGSFFVCRTGLRWKKNYPGQSEAVPQGKEDKSDFYSMEARSCSPSLGER